MKHKLIKLAAFAFLALSANAQALTMDELMGKAVRTGSASGELSGAVSDSLKKATRSVAPTHIAIERVSEDDKCKTMRVTLTQPKVPNTSGGFVGDFVTVSQNVMCSDDRPQANPKVIECRIGPDNCMSPRAGK
jgi:hypothetical protein